MYSIGQKFDGVYPPEAAVWCNENGAIIVQVDGGFEIQGLPQPTADELFARLRSERDARIDSVLWMRERHADEIALGKETTLAQEQYTALLTYIQALRDIPAQPGAPWDGGGDETPWPIMPEF